MFSYFLPGGAFKLVDTLFCHGCRSLRIFCIWETPLPKHSYRVSVSSSQRQYRLSAARVPASVPVPLLRFGLGVDCVLAHVGPLMSRVIACSMARFSIESALSSELILRRHRSGSSWEANIVEPLPSRASTHAQVASLAIRSRVRLRSGR